MLRTSLLAIMLAVVSAPIATAQDPFEIQIYEYQTVSPGKNDLEMHLNRTSRGVLAGTSHLTFEFTHGVTSMFELAGYLLTADRPGVGPEFAGWHIRPRFRLPEKTLPFLFSMSFEIGFPQHQYEPADITLEARPILEKAWGAVQLDLNPTVGKALKGEGSAEAWDFEPGARLGYTVNPTVDLSLEYYASLGAVTDPLPAAQQVHLFYPGADINLSKDVVLNVGVGFGATSAGDTRVIKTRLGWIF